MQACLALVPPIEASQSYSGSFTHPELKGAETFAASQSCSSDSFTSPELKGAKVLSIDASEVRNF